MDVCFITTKESSIILRHINLHACIKNMKSFADSSGQFYHYFSYHLKRYSHFQSAILLTRHLSPIQTSRIDVLKRYLTRIWIKTTSPIELSVHNSKVSTNDSAEILKKLKAYVKTPHPRIWAFIITLNIITIADITRINRDYIIMG